MKEIKVITDNNLDDFIRFNIYTLEKYHKLKLQYKFLVIFGIFCLVFSFFSDFWYLLIIIGIVFISMRFLYPARVVKRIKNYVDESPALISNGEIIFNEYEIIEITDTTTTNIKWEDIYSFDEDERVIYIFFTKLHAFIIRKDLLSLPEVDQLREWTVKERQQ